jgi:hypothetical protein
MDTLKTKPLKGEASSGYERMARLGLVWATGAGVYPGVGPLTPSVKAGPPQRRHWNRSPWSSRLDLDVHLHTIVVGAMPDSSIPTGARTLDAYARVERAWCTGYSPGTGRSSSLSTTCLMPLTKHLSASQLPA